LCGARTCARPCGSRFTGHSSLIRESRHDADRRAAQRDACLSSTHTQRGDTNTSARATLINHQKHPRATQAQRRTNTHTALTVRHTHPTTTRSLADTDEAAAHNDAAALTPRSGDYKAQADPFAASAPLPRWRCPRARARADSTRAAATTTRRRHPAACHPLAPTPSVRPHVYRTRTAVAGGPRPLKHTSTTHTFWGARRAGVLLR
jgi:hypothetical protein